MKWNQYTLETTAEAEDLVLAALYEAGVQGVEIEDGRPLTEEEKKQMFVDIPPAMRPDDGRAFLRFYLEPEGDQEALLARVREALDEMRELADIGPCVITDAETEDKDWINNWKQYFKTFRVDDILIVPSWEKVPEAEDAAVVLHIDPGTAFGTGMHETTQLCLRAVRRYTRTGMELLDVGTGSGILAITALKSGAARAVGTDLDPCTVEAVADNKRANDIAEEAFSLELGNLIDDAAFREKIGTEAYDMVTANILADVLVEMTPAVAPTLRSGGIYITSGILEGQEQKVIDACEACGLKVRSVDKLGEWVCVIAEKP